MKDGIFQIWVFLASSPLLWLTLTLTIYAGSVTLYRKAGSTPFLLPVLTSVLALVSILLLTDTPYPVYFDGAKFIHFMVGPATVALAIPLYGQLQQLKKIWRPVCIALIAGSVTAIVSTTLIAWALGGSLETIVSLAPRSATMPIAMALADHFGGQASLAAVAVALTGISGTIIAHPLLKLFKVQHPAARGFALGVTAHAIGTARALQVHEKVGAFAALGMGLNGILTAMLMPLLPLLLAFLGVLS
ncbi:LrgB family protein [Alcaligenes endophyticus]|uniref:LrgB family protein n=1 Tax=Alcaligenes endophyticus TaxID=1929088 RepID=A0ABT8EG65_9BURK|nr:LrgB family protein [Alcaligenes endophyticus]MCX5590052.1 LrgB family protein [Alcaligenes endophyticus]MDN4120285.1 LrgB family protein [Alcaligenes endophyticus]